MANERLYRENVLFALAEPEAFADRTNPTAAELNSALVHNITCALWEDTTEFTLGDPDKDTGLTFCSKAGVSIATFDNPTVTYSALLDADRTATGVFNAARELLSFPGRQYIALCRIGKDSDVAFATDGTDEIKMVAVETDYRVPKVASGSNSFIDQAFLPQGWINWNFKVVS